MHGNLFRPSQLILFTWWIPIIANEWHLERKLERRKTVFKMHWARARARGELNWRFRVLMLFHCEPHNALQWESVWNWLKCRHIANDLPVKRPVCVKETNHKIIRNKNAFSFYLSFEFARFGLFAVKISWIEIIFSAVLRLIRLIDVDSFAVYDRHETCCALQCRRPTSIKCESKSR